MTKLITLRKTDDPEEEYEVVAPNFEVALHEVRELVREPDEDVPPSHLDKDTFTPVAVAGDSMWGPGYNAATTHEERVAQFNSAFARWREQPGNRGKTIRVVLPEADPGWEFVSSREVHDSDEWEEKFKPVKNTLLPEGSEGPFNSCMFETYDAELSHVKAMVKLQPRNVWTWVEAEGHGYIVPGFHYVNRVGYFITEVPFTEEDEQSEGWFID